MITRLTRDESVALLRGSRIGRLGCISNGEPYVVPINYIFDGESIISHSLPGRKIEAMRENARVCLQVDDIRDQINWRSVIAYGNYEEITSESVRSDVMNQLLSLFLELTPVESLIVEDAHAPVPVVFRVRVDKITGVGEG
jgi:nitroimidazol reductase NimA-like FMN-containing flavoprotein (pyridoxamine 5'-phosphate oxidase superfamily)